MESDGAARAELKQASVAPAAARTLLGTGGFAPPQLQGGPGDVRPESELRVLVRGAGGAGHGVPGVRRHLLH